MTELASVRIMESITQEVASEKANAALRESLASCTATLQQLHREQQKQQGSCWLLEDELAAAQQTQREKAAALTAALGAGHVPSDALGAINKRLADTWVVLLLVVELATFSLIRNKGRLFKLLYGTLPPAASIGKSGRCGSIRLLEMQSGSAKGATTKQPAT